MTGDARADLLQVTARVPRPVRMLAAAAVVAAPVAVVVWVLLPDSRPGADDRLDGGGDGRVGGAPGGQTAGTGGAPPSLVPGAPGAPGAPGVTAAPSGPGVPQVIPVSRPPTPGPSHRGVGELIATYTVGGDLTINVAIANVGGSDVTGWTVVLEFTPLGLLVFSATKLVNHDIKDGQHIFTPTDETLTVPAGASVRFAIVAASDPFAVVSCTIDGRPCLVG